MKDSKSETARWMEGIRNLPESDIQRRVKNEREFEKELSSLINKYSLECGSDTPDFILAGYLMNCLRNFNGIIAFRYQHSAEGNSDG